MATKFAKGDVVRLVGVIPQGPVVKLRMDDEGNFFYLIEWTDVEGKAQSRWFAENELVAA